MAKRATVPKYSAKEVTDAEERAQARYSVEVFLHTSGRWHFFARTSDSETYGLSLESKFNTYGIDTRYHKTVDTAKQGRWPGWKTSGKAIDAAAEFIAKHVAEDLRTELRDVFNNAPAATKASV